MRCLDHRGKVVWVSQQLDPDRKGAVRDTALRRHRVLYAVMALGIFLAATVVAVVTAFVVNVVAPGVPLLVRMVLLNGVAIVLGGIGVAYLQRSFFLRRFAGRLLRAGLCACCDYDLNSVPPEPDGCRICPECGAAWKLPGTSERSAN